MTGYLIKAPEGKKAGQKAKATVPSGAPAFEPEPEPELPPPNPDAQAIIDSHACHAQNLPRSHHVIPYRLTADDMPEFRRPPNLHTAVKGVLMMAGWESKVDPFYIWRIDATRVHFALIKGALSRFACAVQTRYLSTLAVMIWLSQKLVSCLTNTIHLCSPAGTKEFVDVHQSGES